jgi:hypothetical protein
MGQGEPAAGHRGAPYVLFVPVGLSSVSRTLDFRVREPAYYC